VKTYPENPKPLCGMDEYRGGHPVPWRRKKGTPEAPLAFAAEKRRRWESNAVLIDYCICMSLK